ncbi:hypothetical protein [uncultured Winogradskyella sp.]|uniref:hypothetical protein n=1 Tax=uncultured Winogradskyella sp. TaxID=395353 RepID=UPI00262A936A|nr:hypothetical protein [uncultured Winogradskyella sp.]
MEFEYQHFLDRYKVLDNKFIDPNLYNDTRLYAVTLKEYSILKPIVILVNQINSLKVEIKDYKSLIKTCTEDEEEDINSIIKKNESILSEKEEELKEKIDKNNATETNNIKKSESIVGVKKSKSSFEKIAKKIKKRDWNKLREVWIKHIPFIDSSIQKEEEKISELYGFEQLIKQLSFSNAELLNEGKPVSIVTKGKLNKQIRSLTVKKGLFLLNKASHIISAGELHAHQGLKTWALSSSYQGALLAARSIISLMGISIVDYEGKSYIIDSFGVNNNGLSISDNEVCLDIIEYSYGVKHRETWEIFKRILKSFKIDPWNKEIVASILKQDVGNFSQQRNSIHYWGNSWIFDDLHEYRIDRKFGVYDNIHEGLNNFELKSDFSLTLSLAILRMGIVLVKDLSKLTNNLQKEERLLHEFLYDYDRHPMYVSNF